jgi:hypothetical protein
MERVKFAHVFMAVFVGTAIVAAALLINAKRPDVDTRQPSASYVKATGKCAE